jgi:hypothetical protein
VKTETDNNPAKGEAMNYTVEIETTVLTDGSKVYSVRITNTDSSGESIELDCLDRKRAEAMQVDIISTINRNGC